MDRRHREELDRRLAQARRLALEPSDPLTRERLAVLIEDLEFQASASAQGRLRHSLVRAGRDG